MRNRKPEIASAMTQKTTATAGKDKRSRFRRGLKPFNMA